MKNVIYILLVLFAINSANAELKLTFPNAGEKLITGSDTLISWEKNNQGDTLFLEYSLDNGKTWKLLNKSTTENNYLWKNIPNAKNAKPLMRAISRSEIYLKEDEPYIEWSKTFGGTLGDSFNSIIQIDNGNFIVSGNSYSENGDLDTNKGKIDVWITEIDSKGNLLWSKTLGGNNIDWLSKMLRLTKEKGFILSGTAVSTDGDFIRDNDDNSIFIIKFNEQKEIEWQKNYFGLEGSDFVINFLDIELSNNDEIIMISDTVDSIYRTHILNISKINSKGEIFWSKSYSGESVCKNCYIVAKIINKSKNNEFLIGYETGTSIVPNNKRECGIISLQDNDKIKKIVFYTGNDWDFIDNILTTKNGEYLCMFTSSSQNGDFENNYGGYDIYFKKYNKNWELEWSKNYGGSDSDGNGFTNEFTNDIIEIKDNKFICFANSSSKDGDVKTIKNKLNVWGFMLDSLGNIIWQNTYGGNENDCVCDFIQTSDKGYILCGQTFSSDGDITTKNRGGSDAWILKLSVKYQDIDTVTVPFSIIYPLMASHDIDMGEAYIKTDEDSVITNFIENIGECKFRVDSIYFRGADKTAFSLIDGFPKYTIQPQESHFAKFRFVPQRVGIHNAEIVIITQTDTLIQKITGSGLKKYPEIATELTAFNTIICENSTATELKISNTGGDTLKISEINLIGTNYSDFSINTTLPLNIEQDSTKTLTISFKPKTIGIKTAEVEIKSNALAEPIIKITISARKDSIALVPDVQTINLGKLFPGQTKDTLFTIENKGTIETAGHCDLSSNLSCNNSTFSIDKNNSTQFNFTFSGIANEGKISEKITVWDEVCKYSREVIITGEVVNPHLKGFSAVQCVGYENEYKLKVHNPSSNRFNITEINFDKNPNLFKIIDNLPITISPNEINHEIKLTFKNAHISKFNSIITCKTDNKFISVLNDTIFAETVQYSRNTTSLINGEEHTQSNPFPISYDTASTFGKNKFTYSINTNKAEAEIPELSHQSDMELIIDYNSNVIAPDFDEQTHSPKVLLGSDLGANYKIKTAEERKIDEYHSQIIVLIENTGQPIIKNEAFELISLDFGAYMSNNGLNDSINNERARTVIISHSIKNNDDCLSYKTASTANLTIEKLCLDDVWQVKIPDTTHSKFYFNNVIPHPIGTNGATLDYGIGFDCKVTITVYDLSGNIIFIPIDENQSAGKHQQTISTKEFAAGIYYIELKAGPFKETKKVVVE